jgi:polyisoprenoid-binding protein YceI
MMEGQKSKRRFSKGVLMKTLLALVLSFSTVLAFAAPKAETKVAAKPTAETFKVDPAQSKIEWHGKKVTGDHKGTIGVKGGTLVFTGDLLTAGEVLVDMNTLNCTDITDAETNGKFVGHMKSPDFFDTAAHPEAKLVIKSSKKVAKGLEVKGDLTLKGKTHPVTFIADVKKTDKSVTGNTVLNLDRTKWDLKYGSGKFFKGLGDKMIHDEFTLTINITANM